MVVGVLVLALFVGVLVLLFSLRGGESYTPEPQGGTTHPDVVKQDEEFRNATPLRTILGE
jgi:hypothetical protein